MSMESLAEILEQELEEAVEVKNKKSFHRFIVLLTGNMVDRISYREETGNIRSDLREMMHLMEKKFDAVDKRFEVMDQRFESMEKRFSMMFAFMSLGFTMLAVLFTVFNFL